MTIEDMLRKGWKVSLEYCDELGYFIATVNPTPVDTLFYKFDSISELEETLERDVQSDWNALYDDRLELRQYLRGVKRRQ